MKLYFEIEYHTKPGQNIAVCGSIDALGNWNQSNAIQLHYKFDGKWSAEIDLNDEPEKIEYKYCLIDEFDNAHWEWGKNRFLSLKEDNNKNVYLIENWRAPSKEEKVFYSSAFEKNLMSPKHHLKARKSNRKKSLRFQIQVPRIGGDYQLCILGNITQLGNWDSKSPLLLTYDDNFPLWSGEINASSIKEPIYYKYGIYHIKKKELVTLEEGEDRYFEIPKLKDDQFLLTKSDESFRYPIGNWKAAGVAVPVFSLRTEKSCGVGEFNDLIDLIDWAKSVDMKMLQILPINETVASHNWLDSYPYKSISVVALHPLYLNLQKMGILKDKKQMRFFKEKQKEYNE